MLQMGASQPTENCAKSRTRPLKELQKDYGLMRSMFFREVPAWELILKTVSEFENEFNKE